jgi:hypothetical protein
MFSGADIQRMQQSATREAARNRREPVVLFSSRDAFEDWRSAPFLGEYKPAGWRPLKVHELRDVAGIGDRLWRVDGEDRALFFVDGSGWGADDEPALSVSQQKAVAVALHDWAEKLRHTVGVGIVEVGQFQAVLGVWIQRADYWERRTRQEERLEKRREKAYAARRRAVAGGR